MNCWHCKSELIWGGDHSFEDHGLDSDGIVSNLSCPNCPVDVLVYYNTDEEKDYDYGSRWVINVYGLEQHSTSKYPSIDTGNELDLFELKL